MTLKKDVDEPQHTIDYDTPVEDKPKEVEDEACESCTI